MKTKLFTYLFLFYTTLLFSQADTIYLANPSFEDYPRVGHVPIGWVDCGFEGETPADTHPSGAFKVEKEPADGGSYVGLVTRDNDTWEGIRQELNTPLLAGNCYAFNLKVCRSEFYLSISRITRKTTNFTEPIKLVIWGGNELCEKKEKLGETPVIAHTNWEDYLFHFVPQKDLSYIKLEAFYKMPILFPYNGNILIDNASAIIPIPCEEK